jgi:hypothetical protein|tara:strand:- start:287 stop:388 length:102 start_codon:yes stop_codon:yes gene_type:complete
MPEWLIVVLAVLGTFALASLLGELLVRRVRRRR